MSYDLLLVGCGIGSATIASLLKGKCKILAIDVRSHLGGNCYDYKSNQTYIHQYGPHIFHTRNKRIEQFMKQFGNWIEYRHSAIAEFKHSNKIYHVPFPYSSETVKTLKKLKIPSELSESDVINLFFRDYSRKMWGQAWEDLPISIRNRVPKHIKGRSEYFKGDFCGLPELGYTYIIERMFEGVDKLLGVPSDFWKTIPAKRIVYCGRIDYVLSDVLLKYRSLDIEHRIEQRDLGPKAVVNYCHADIPFTRRTNYNLMYKGEIAQENSFVSYETPRDGSIDLVPFYPSCELEELEKAELLKREIKKVYPNLYFLGRLGTYKYLNIDQVIGQAMELVKQFSN